MCCNGLQKSYHIEQEAILKQPVHIAHLFYATMPPNRAIEREFIPTQPCHIAHLSYICTLSLYILLRAAPMAPQARGYSRTTLPYCTFILHVYILLRAAAMAPHRARGYSSAFSDSFFCHPIWHIYSMRVHTVAALRVHTIAGCNNDTQTGQRAIQNRLFCHPTSLIYSMRVYIVAGCNNDT